MNFESYAISFFLNWTIFELTSLQVAHRRYTKNEMVYTCMHFYVHNCIKEMFTGQIAEFTALVGLFKYLWLNIYWKIFRIYPVGEYKFTSLISMSNHYIRYDIPFPINIISNFQLWKPIQLDFMQSSGSSNLIWQRAVTNWSLPRWLTSLRPE